MYIYGVGIQKLCYLPRQKYGLVHAFYSACRTTKAFSALVTVKFIIRSTGINNKTIQIQCVETKKLNGKCTIYEAKL